jgi:hypothetical protein
VFVNLAIAVQAVGAAVADAMLRGWIRALGAAAPRCSAPLAVEVWWPFAPQARGATQHARVRRGAGRATPAVVQVGHLHTHVRSHWLAAGAREI